MDIVLHRLCYIVPSNMIKCLTNPVGSENVRFINEIKTLTLGGAIGKHNQSVVTDNGCHLHDMVLTDKNDP